MPVPSPSDKQIIESVGKFTSYKGMNGVNLYKGKDKTYTSEGELLQGAVAKQLLAQLNPSEGWSNSAITKLNNPLAAQVAAQPKSKITINAARIAGETPNPEKFKQTYEKAFGNSTVTISKSTLNKLSNSAKIVTHSDMVPKELFQAIQAELIDKNKINKQETRTLGEILQKEGLEKEWLDKYKGYFKDEESLQKAFNTPLMLLASNVCHSQEVHFFVEQHNVEGNAFNKLKSGNLDNQTPCVVLSVPGINVAYSGITATLTADDVLLHSKSGSPLPPASKLINNMWESALDSAILQGCRNIAMPSIGLGAFAGNHGETMAPIYFKTLFKLLSSEKYKGKFDNILFNPAGYSKQFDEELGKFKGKFGDCNVQNFKGDVKMLAIEFAKNGKKCALLNPSDADVVWGKYDVGEYYKNGDYVGEEDIAATSTAVLGSKGISDVYTNSEKIFSVGPQAPISLTANSKPNSINSVQSSQSSSESSLSKRSISSKPPSSKQYVKVAWNHLKTLLKEGDVKELSEEAVPLLEKDRPNLFVAFSYDKENGLHLFSEKNLKENDLDTSGKMSVFLINALNEYDNSTQEDEQERFIYQTYKAAFINKSGVLQVEYGKEIPLNPLSFEVIPPTNFKKGKKEEEENTQLDEIEEENSGKNLGESEISDSSPETAFRDRVVNEAEKELNKGAIPAQPHSERDVEAEPKTTFEEMTSTEELIEEPKPESELLGDEGGEPEPKAPKPTKKYQGFYSTFNQRARLADLATVNSVGQGMTEENFAMCIDDWDKKISEKIKDGEPIRIESETNINPKEESNVVKTIIERSDKEMDTIRHSYNKQQKCPVVKLSNKPPEDYGIFIFMESSKKIQPLTLQTKCGPELAMRLFEASVISGTKIELQPADIKSLQSDVRYRDRYEKLAALQKPGNEKSLKEFRKQLKEKSTEKHELGKTALPNSTSLGYRFVETPKDESRGTPVSNEKMKK